MLTEEQLKAIEERAAKATPGPWFLDVDGWPYRGGKYDGIVPYWDDQREPPGEGNPYSPSSISFDTLEFVAHAREDVPALLEEVKRLQEALVEERAWANEFEGQAKVNLMQLQGGFGSPTLVKQVEDTYSRPERKKYLNIERARAELQSEGRIPK